jgi:hypothetical protein
MARIVLPHAVPTKKPKTLYFVDREGSLWERPATRGKGKEKIVRLHAIDREPRTLYFVDGDGNLCAAPMKKR